MAGAIPLFPAESTGHYVECMTGKRKSKGIYQHALRTLKHELKGKSKKKEKKRSRSGPNFFEGDDLRKTAMDRKRRGSKYEYWER